MSRGDSKLGTTSVKNKLLVRLLFIFSVSQTKFGTETENTNQKIYLIRFLIATARI